jgi:hypothetical protein
VAYLGEVLPDLLTKKQSLITTIIEVFSNIPREDLKRATTPLAPCLFTTEFKSKYLPKMTLPCPSHYHDQKPSSRTYNFVEVSGLDLESFYT